MHGAELLVLLARAGCVVGALLVLAGRLTHVPTRSCSSSAAPCSGSCPGVPDVELDPDVILLVVLPPLLYAAAFFTLAARPARQRARRSGCWRSGS